MTHESPRTFPVLHSSSAKGIYLFKGSPRQAFERRARAEGGSLWRGASRPLCFPNSRTRGERRLPPAQALVTQTHTKGLRPAQGTLQQARGWSPAKSSRLALRCDILYRTRGEADLPRSGPDTQRTRLESNSCDCVPLGVQAAGKRCEKADSRGKAVVGEPVQAGLGGPFRPSPQTPAPQKPAGREELTATGFQSGSSLFKTHCRQICASVLALFLLVL